jgi:hypothetical protein
MGSIFPARTTGANATLSDQVRSGPHRRKIDAAAAASCRRRTRRPAQVLLAPERRSHFPKQPTSGDNSPADPADRRAKLVLPTDRGRDVFAVAQGLLPEVEDRIRSLLGDDRALALRNDLEVIRRAATRKDETAV